jgi:FAD/FMN-containing dehydrogenase
MFTVTKQYLEMNQHDALYKQARGYPGGLEALAQRMGISVNVLRNKLSPVIGTHYPSFEEVSEITELCQEARRDDALFAIRAMNWRHGLVAFQVPTASCLSDDELATNIYRVVKEIGEVANSVSGALEDRKITHAEFDLIERDFAEAMGALITWRERVRARAVADSGPIPDAVQ